MFSFYRMFWNCQKHTHTGIACGGTERATFMLQFVEYFIFLYLRNVRTAAVAFVCGGLIVCTYLFALLLPMGEEGIYFDLSVGGIFAALVWLFLYQRWCCCTFAVVDILFLMDHLNILFQEKVYEYTWYYVYSLTIFSVARTWRLFQKIMKILHCTQECVWLMYGVASILT